MTLGSFLTYIFPDLEDKLLTEIALFLDSHTPVDAMCLLSLLRELQELQVSDSVICFVVVTFY